MESMSCGIPVVTTKVGMAEDVIQKGIPGAISNEINPNDLAEKIELVLETFYKNKESSQKIIRNQIKKFDWKEIAKQHWDKVYKDVI